RRRKEQERRNGKMVGNLGRNIPMPQCAPQRVILMGIRSAKPLWASGHAPREQAGYMTAPSRAQTPIFFLAQRGPSIQRRFLRHAKSLEG
ncbi:hypothetical protein, partial [Methylosinus sp. Ce-a6]|uniref:hypothetical protein n=1 Tax=Methylosinus sp. Ce-a6 TaxID=2172005 RepID=UPI001AEDB2CB